MVTTGLIAIDATVLATAVPSIVAISAASPSSRGCSRSTCSRRRSRCPIYAKLADMVGRKPIILFGIGLFLLGSILCGFAWSMPALIAFRAVQGLGAGAVQPMAITIVGDIYTRRRAREGAGLHRERLGASRRWSVRPSVACSRSWASGAGSSSSTSRSACWRRGCSGATSTRRSSAASTASTTLGAALLASAMTLLILGVLEGGQAWAWNSPSSIAAFAVGARAARRVRVRRAPGSRTVLPLWVFSRRLLLTTTLIGLASAPCSSG